MSSTSCQFPGCGRENTEHHWFFKKWHCAQHDPHKVIWPDSKAGKVLEEIEAKEMDYYKKEKLKRRFMQRRGFGKRYF